MTLGNPFPPRDGHCLSLSLSIMSFVIRKKNFGLIRFIFLLPLCLKSLKFMFSENIHSGLCHPECLFTKAHLVAS